MLKKVLIPLSFAAVISVTAIGGGKFFMANGLEDQLNQKIVEKNLESIGVKKFECQPDWGVLGGTKCHSKIDTIKNGKQLYTNVDFDVVATKPVQLLSQNMQNFRDMKINIAFQDIKVDNKTMKEYLLESMNEAKISNDMKDKFLQQLTGDYKVAIDITNHLDGDLDEMGVVGALKLGKINVSASMNFSVPESDFVASVRGEEELSMENAIARDIEYKIAFENKRFFQEMLEITGESPEDVAADVKVMLDMQANGLSKKIKDELLAKVDDLVTGRSGQIAINLQLNQPLGSVGQKAAMSSIYAKSARTDVIADIWGDDVVATIK
jgi:hypothetical protein